jgi:hypothetical protein
LKTYLKNKCSYARKQGYLTETTNQKQDDEAQGQEEQEEQEEQEGQERCKGKGKEREMEVPDCSDDMYGFHIPV